MGLALSNQLLASEFCFSLDIKKIKVILFSLVPLAVTSISLFLSLIFSLENLGYMYWLILLWAKCRFFLLTKVCLISSEIALICFLSPTWMQREHVIFFFNILSDAFHNFHNSPFSLHYIQKPELGSIILVFCTPVLSCLKFCRGSIGIVPVVSYFCLIYTCGHHCQETILFYQFGFMSNVFSVVGFFEVIYFSWFPEIFIYISHLQTSTQSLFVFQTYQCFFPFLNRSFSLIMQLRLYFDCLIKILASRSVGFLSFYPGDYVAPSYLIIHRRVSDLNV